MLLRVDVEDRDDHALVALAGEIDAGTATEVEDAVSGALANRHTRVMLDLSHVTFIDSSGLGVLVSSHRKAESSGARLVVVHPSARTRQLMRLLGLDQLLFLYDSREQALSDPC
jgi:anti-sigma B factor antagonist